MDSYVQLATTIEELSRMVRDFGDQTKKLKEKVGLLGTTQDCKELRDGLPILREQCINSSKQLCQLFKSPPAERSERWKHVKLAQDFEAILKEFERAKAQALSKEKQWIDIVRESISSEEYRS